MREKRDEILILRITKTEKNRIYEKMYGMGIRSLSAYMQGVLFNTSPLVCVGSLLLIGTTFAAASVVALKKQSY